MSLLPSIPIGAQRDDGKSSLPQTHHVRLLNTSPSSHTVRDKHGKTIPASCEKGILPIPHGNLFAQSFVKTGAGPRALLLRTGKRSLTRQRNAVPFKEIQHIVPRQYTAPTTPKVLALRIQDSGGLPYASLARDGPAADAPVANGLQYSESSSPHQNLWRLLWT